MTDYSKAPKCILQLHNGRLCLNTRPSLGHGGHVSIRKLLCLPAPSLARPRRSSPAVSSPSKRPQQTSRRTERASSPPPARPPTRRRRNPLRRLSNKSRLRRRRKVQSGIVFISPSGEGKRDPNAERASTESGTSCAAHNSQRGRRQEGEIPGVIADLYAPFPLRQNRKRGHHASHRTRSHMNYE